MLQSLALIFIIGFSLGQVFQKLRFPSLIGYLLTGILLGPYVFNLLDGSLMEIAAELREIALLIILTQAGLSLEFNDFKKMGSKAIFMSFVPACFEITATFFISQILFGLSPVDALLLGAIIASASPAVIVPRMLRLMKENYGTKKGIPQLILTGDSVDDVFNIVVFSAVLSMNSGGTFKATDLLVIPFSTVLGILIGIVVGFVVAQIFKRLKTAIEMKTMLMLSLGFAFLAVEPYVEQFFPFSALIAVMAAGVGILRFSPKDAFQITGQLAKLWVGAQILLFALVGATVNISYASVAGPNAILMLLFSLSVRALGIFICLLGSGYNFKEKLFCMLAGIPKATVQAAIGGIPLAMGLPSGEIILAISVITILVTAPIGGFLLDNFYKKLLTHDTHSNHEDVVRVTH